MRYIWTVLGVVSLAAPAVAQSSDVQQAVETILTLCMAGGERVTITGGGGAGVDISLKRLDAAGRINGEFKLDKTQARGLVEGLSNAMSSVTAQQADKVRECIRPYRDRIMNLILPPEGARPDSARPGSIVPPSKPSPTTPPGSSAPPSKPSPTTGPGSNAPGSNVPSPTTPPSIDGFTLRAGTNLYGTGLGSISPYALVREFTECARTCRNIARCAGFSFHKVQQSDARHYCYLYGPPIRPLDDPSWTSGIRN